MRNEPAAGTEPRGRSSRASVSAPGTPSTARPSTFWKAITAEAVALP